MRLARFAALAMLALGVSLPPFAWAADTGTKSEGAAKKPSAPLTVTGGPTQPKPSPEAIQKANTDAMLALLSDTETKAGEVPYKSLTGVAGNTFDVWAGPVMKAGDITCRYVLIGGVAEQRVDQSLIACRTGQEAWQVKTNPDRLPDAHQAMLKARLGKLPEIGTNIDPLRPAK